MSFLNLPPEVLLIIFGYCDPLDLYQLYGVCSRFSDLTKTLFNKRSKHLLITSEKMKKFRDRCYWSVQSTKYSTCLNWKNGLYLKTKLTNSPAAYSDNFPLNAPRVLGMTKNTVLFQYGPERYYAFNRTKYSESRIYVCINDYSAICNIIPCDDVFFTNNVKGNIRLWTFEVENGTRMNVDQYEIKSNESTYDFYKDTALNGYDYIMDVTSRHIVLGAGKGKIKIMKYSREEKTVMEENIICESTQNSGYFMNILAFDPTGAKLIAKFTDDYMKNTNYVIYDINKGCTETVRKSVDIDCANQLSWEDNNTILLKGSTQIKKVDLRTHDVVQTWMSPLNVRHKVPRIFTCMSTDYQYAIMTGNLRGEVILYDQRQSSLVQTYIPQKCCDCVCEPFDRIHALEFDSSQMYILSDAIYELDFA